MGIDYHLPWRNQLAFLRDRHQIYRHQHIYSFSLVPLPLILKLAFVSFESLV